MGFIPWLVVVNQIELTFFLTFSGQKKLEYLLQQTTAPIRVLKNIKQSKASL